MAGKCMARRGERLGAWWTAEAPRRILWLPACFAAGIALYYNLPVEPPGWLFPALTLLVLLGMRAARRWLNPLQMGLAVALLAAGIGAGWANLRAREHQPTILRESLTPRPIMGVVRDIERTEHGVRLTLSQPMIDRLAPALTPSQVRLSVRLKKGVAFTLPNIGDAVTIRAGLMVPMGPALPNGFDFARYFAFRDIGAVGYGLPPWEVLASDNRPSLANRFWSWRANLTDSIVRRLGPETGGIAAGLITGDARAISEEDFKALRASNLYHIIAISGEHMMVISGVIFISLRLLLLLLFPARIALRPEGKSVIALISLLLVSVYLFVTGLPISAVRAYVMIALVLGAILLRRQVDPMRSLALTALLLLLYDPASLLEPGFQLSFAATLALIALIETRVMAPSPLLEQSRLRRGLHHLGTILLASVVAEMATGPLVIAMFNNIAPYGILANSLATPLVSLFLMPMVALFFILLPFGLHPFALTLLGAGIHALLSIAHWIAQLPYAQLFSPSLPGYGVALFMFGLLWICLWQTRVRRYGVIPAVVGVLTVLTVSQPDMLMSANLKQIAFRSDNGYVLARGRAASLVPELWGNGLGYKELPPADKPDWRCDALGCVAQVKGIKIAFPSDAAAWQEDCIHAAVIVSGLAVRECQKPVRIINPTQDSGSNITALWVRDDGSIRQETSADWQGVRPWSVQDAAEPQDGD
ncbi:MAG: ComEC/Rec2 family competence protein [Alphaproteobacteria bacterium]|nr:ComEC/Rec2 family competence protein [Alphaproteobacteria bacterium]